ncbi:A-kinase anchor protein 13 [Acipenser ruthenus]|uniref:A-kinase anchor protein 13 n=1 Tax=Acipenser ruthenus TaxID=7906 RepID=A0A444UR86_ACIRT|nr:A-kinase anchor protein 13 [Acipenser ruthenus]
MLRGSLVALRELTLSMLRGSLVALGELTLSMLRGSRGSSSTSSSLAHSICEEDLPPSPLRKDLDSKSGTKVSRTLSFLKNKMYNSKKSREKDKEKTKEKDCKEKDKDKKALNGHMFSIAASGPSAQCYQCSKAVNAKEAYLCASEYCSMLPG